MPAFGLGLGIGFQRGPSGRNGESFIEPPVWESPGSTSTTITLNWSRSENPATEFQASKRQGDGAWSFPATIPASDRTVTFIALTPATEYEFRITAIEGGLQSAYATGFFSTQSPPPPEFAPTDIAGCKLWLKADGNVYNAGTTQATDGQTVETWADASGQSNNSVQTTGVRRPVFKDTGGVKSLLTAGAEWMDTTWNAGATCSIFVVYKNSGSTNGRWVSGGNNWLLGPYSFNYSYYSNTGFAGGSTSSNGNTTIRIHNTVQTSGGGQHWLNGVSQGTVGSAGAPGVISAPGTYLSGGELGSGHIYEVIGYDSALSTADREAVEDYLGTKYGVTITH